MTTKCGRESDYLDVPNATRVIEKGIQLANPFNITKMPKVDAPIGIHGGHCLVRLVVSHRNSVRMLWLGIRDELIR